MSILLTGILGAFTSACGATNSSVHVSVTPSSSFADEPVHFAVGGLNAGQSVTLDLTSTDAAGLHWRSSATFSASSSGTVDLDATAPNAGSYRGVFGMGLIASMRLQTDASREYVYSGVSPQYSEYAPQMFTITAVSDGQTLGSTTFARRLAAPVLAHYITLQTAGFIGTYYTPSGTGLQPTAVLAFGGSEGGNTTTLLGVMLASHGFATLSIAYFKAPGLPQSLSNIPMEYFVKAIQWLDAQPGIDPKHVVVSGGSRGSEAALLLAAHYPKLVHGVIASVPSDVALCGLPCSQGAAWTLGGNPLPYTRQFNQPYPTDTPAAVIPVEAIDGPILLDCGGVDHVWTSCSFAEAIQARLTAYHDRYAHMLYAYPHAGHGIGSLLPYEPENFPQTPDFAGDSPAANAAALGALWPQVLAFLQTTG